jgi:uncharacterized membrane protein YvlD (DUF360 family)
VKPVIFLFTAAFGLLVAAVVFCLAFVLLKLGLKSSLIISAVLGAIQAAWGLFYIYRRFKHQSQPPRDGGNFG